MTPRGFVSIVEKPWDRDAETLTVRARVREDLVQLLDRADVPKFTAREIVESDDSDYRYRVQLTRAEVTRLVTRAVADVTYGNFKDEVRRRQGDRRATVYAQVWHALASLQPRIPPGGGLFDGPAFDEPAPPARDRADRRGPRRSRRRR